jgi:hypothetical protein
MQTSMIPSFETISHRPGGNGGRIAKRVGELFALHSQEFLTTRKLARETAELVGRIDPLIERHTASVCPGCTGVCCANRHSYHTHEDVVYLCALGEEVPVYDLRIGDHEPCQFIGEGGCLISRVLRPHRCNSYFCTSLLDDMEKGEAKEYRRFVKLMKELTDTRMAMLRAFAVTAERLCCNTSDYQIDF